MITAKTLRRILAEHNYAIVPVTPNAKMVKASMAEVSGFTLRVTKDEKHRLRLIAAIKAACP